MSLSIKEEYEQAMPDMDASDFEALKESIDKHGIEYPVLVDREGYIIDGHHRYKAWQELDKDEDIPTIVVDTEDDIERALRPNLARRDFASGQKREAVKRYLLNHWDGERTQEKVATDLGVDRKTVRNAITDLRQSGKNENLPIFSKAEKRQHVRNYISENPNASNRDVAQAVEADVSHATVGIWRKEWENGDSSDTDKTDNTTKRDSSENGSGLKAYATDSKDVEAATHLFKEREADETAEEKAKEVTRGKQSPSDAKKNYEREKRKKREEEAAETSQEALEADQSERNSKFTIEQGDTITLGNHTLYCGDSSGETFKNLVPESAFAFADPPYNAGSAEWDHDFQWQHDWLNDTADVVAVTPGIGSIFDFARTTELPYQWSVACWIKNGRARGKMGYGNWVYVGIFSDESVHRNSQDIVTVTIKESEKDESHHRGRKFTRLMTWLFERFCPVGETVIDPFLGSGTTLLAAEEANRTCVGAEINPEFCEEIVTRWENLTGEKAEVNT